MKNFNKFITELRQESNDILSIVNNGQNIYKSLKEVPTDALEIAANAYRNSKCDKV